MGMMGHGCPVLDVQHQAQTGALAFIELPVPRNYYHTYNVGTHNTESVGFYLPDYDSVATSQEGSAAPAAGAPQPVFV